MHKAGFPETVATCGTALTTEHLEKIRRLTRNLVLLLDADEAGLKAAERALPLCLKAGIQPWRLELPGAKDPDEFGRIAVYSGIEDIDDSQYAIRAWAAALTPTQPPTLVRRTALYVLCLCAAILGLVAGYWMLILH